jgi:hypothetical protein
MRIFRALSFWASLVARSVSNRTDGCCQCSASSCTTRLACSPSLSASLTITAYPSTTQAARNRNSLVLMANQVCCMHPASCASVPVQVAGCGRLSSTACAPSRGPRPTNSAAVCDTTTITGRALCEELDAVVRNPQNTATASSGHSHDNRTQCMENRMHGCRAR